MSNVNELLMLLLLYVVIGSRAVQGDSHSLTLENVWEIPHIF